MTALNAFGAGAVTLMMLFYWLEDRSAVFTLAFAIACLASSAYGWLAGTWPFGIVEAVWGAVAFRKWWGRRGGATPARSYDARQARPAR